MSEREISQSKPITPEMPARSPEELAALKERIANARLLVVNFCRKMLRGHESLLAEDLAHAALEKAIRHIDQFRGEAKLETWILTIARNEVFGLFRSKKSDVLEHRLGEEFFADPEHRAERERDMHIEEASGGDTVIERVAFERAIEKLDEDEAAAIRSLALGRTAEEISASLGISVAAAKSRIHRARKHLAELMER